MDRFRPIDRQLAHASDFEILGPAVRMSLTEPLLIIGNTLGVMALCTMFYGYCQRRVQSFWCRRLMVGLSFGCGGWLMMLQPLDLSNGFQADPRTAFVGMATAFGGWISGVAATVIIFAVRIWIGGEGTALGIAIVSATFISAGAWRALHPASMPRTSRHMLVLSGLLVVPLCLSFVRPEASHIAIVLLLATLVFVNVFLFGALMDYEQMRGRQERALRLAALTDPLTAIPNRRAFEEATHARSGQRKLALFILDIDHFKNINDTFGHDAGDLILRKCASILKSCHRQGEICARLGGEEFGMILFASDRAEALERAEALCRALRTEVEYEGQAVSVTVSVGGYYSTERGFAADYYLRRADEALYKAKRSGRNCINLVGSTDRG